jgi:hypothetical protein
MLASQDWGEINKYRETKSYLIIVVLENICSTI